MAVDWFATSTPPIRFAPGTTVIAELSQDVIFASNWAAGRTYETLLRWDEGSLPPASLGIVFEDFNRVEWQFRAFVPPHHDRLVALARFTLAAGTATGQVTIEVGADSIVLSRSSSGTSGGNQTIDNTGAGMQPVKVTIARTAGIGTMRLSAISLMAVTSSASALRAPEDE